MRPLRTQRPRRASLLTARPAAALRGTQPGRGGTGGRLLGRRLFAARPADAARRRRRIRRGLRPDVGRGISPQGRKRGGVAAATQIQIRAERYGRLLHRSRRAAARRTAGALFGHALPDRGPSRLPPGRASGTTAHGRMPLPRGSLPGRLAPLHGRNGGRKADSRRRLPRQEPFGLAALRLHRPHRRRRTSRPGPGGPLHARIPRGADAAPELLRLPVQVGPQRERHHAGRLLEHPRRAARIRRRPRRAPRAAQHAAGRPAFRRGRRREPPASLGRPGARPQRRIPRTRRTPPAPRRVLPRAAPCGERHGSADSNRKTHTLATSRADFPPADRPLTRTAP